MISDLTPNPRGEIEGNKRIKKYNSKTKSEISFINIVMYEMFTFKFIILNICLWFCIF